MNEQIIPILMPKWGLAMKEGTLAVWHVEEGAEIVQGDEIMDVETDKISNAVEAADGGLLRRRVGAEGEIYPVKALLGVLAPPNVTDDEVQAYIDAYEMPDIEEEEEAAPSYKFADLGIGRIRYTERSGAGSPILLIHGFGGDLDNWLFNIDTIAETNAVVALDLPGHGQSTKAIDTPTAETMVQAVVELLDHLAIPKAHLVGHSMGGLIAGLVAAKNPEKVESLTLVAPAGLGKEVNVSYLNGFVDASSRRELKPHLKLLFADEGLVSRAMVDDLLKYKRLDGVDKFLKALVSNMFPDGQQSLLLTDQLTNFSGKIQTIWGDKDAIIPASHVSALNGAETHVIQGIGHMVQMEDAAGLCELIKNAVR